MRPTSRFTAHEADRLRALDGTPLASFGPRALAFLIDMLIVLPIYGAIAVWWEIKHVTPGENVNVHLNPFHGIGGIALMILYFGLSTYAGRGRTLGKRLMKLRVVSTAHERLSLWQCIERALGYGASALEGGFGFIQYFIHPNHRTVHDRIAETIVVSERAVQPKR